MGAGSGAGVLLALWWHCHCAAIGAETGLGLPYLRQSEFMILNNEAVRVSSPRGFGQFSVSGASPPPHAG